PLHPDQRLLQPRPDRAPDDSDFARRRGRAHGARRGRGGRRLPRPSAAQPGLSARRAPAGDRRGCAPGRTRSGAAAADRPGVHRDRRHRGRTPGGRGRGALADRVLRLDADLPAVPGLSRLRGARKGAERAGPCGPLRRDGGARAGRAARGGRRARRAVRPGRGDSRALRWRSGPAHLPLCLDPGRRSGGAPRRSGRRDQVRRPGGRRWERDMKVGLYLRNMGPQSTRTLIAEAARAAEEAGVDDLWVADHLAIAPEESEGSDGRYLEPLATLAFLAGITERIGLGVGVLIVPYRPALLSAKWIATIQELSGGRFI